ncbi:MAG: hypothetical protein WKI04_00660 [Ferruginibacter sp.]
MLQLIYFSFQRLQVTCLIFPGRFVCIVVILRDAIFVGFYEVTPAVVIYKKREQWVTIQHLPPSGPHHYDNGGYTHRKLPE